MKAEDRKNIPRSQYTYYEDTYDMQEQSGEQAKLSLIMRNQSR